VQSADLAATPARTIAARKPNTARTAIQSHIENARRRTFDDAAAGDSK